MAFKPLRIPSLKSKQNRTRKLELFLGKDVPSMPDFSAKENLGAPLVRTDASFGANRGTSREPCYGGSTAIAKAIVARIAGRFIRAASVLTVGKRNTRAKEGI